MSEIRETCPMNYVKKDAGILLWEQHIADQKISPQQIKKVALCREEVPRDENFSQIILICRCFMYFWDWLLKKCWEIQKIAIFLCYEEKC